MTVKLRPITLVDQVVEELGRLIRKRKPKTGSELPSIAELTTRFGVSKVVVREALKSLEAQGVVELQNGRRPRIAGDSTRPLVSFFVRAVDLDTGSIDEMAAICRTLEIESAGLAAINRTEAELQAMQGIVDEQVARVDDLDDFGKLDDELHRVILEAGRNRMLSNLVCSMRDTLVKSDATAWSPLPSGSTVDEHAQLNADLVNAVMHRDSEAARRVMERRFEAPERLRR